MRRFHVYLVGYQHRTVRASSPEAAEAVALAEARTRWPDIEWTASHAEEEL